MRVKKKLPVYYALPGSTQCFMGRIIPLGYIKMVGPKDNTEQVAQPDGTWSKTGSKTIRISSK